MDVIALLKQDHRTLLNLFSRFERGGPGRSATKHRLVEQIVELLSRHSAAEEQLVYPALREKEKALSLNVLVALEEHHAAKLLLLEIDRLKPNAERFFAKVKVLGEIIESHIREEEAVLLPRLRKVFGPAELEGLGAHVAEAKRAAPTHPHPRAPDQPPANLVAGMFAKVMDSGKDIVKTVTRGQPFARTARRSAGRTKPKKR